MKGSLSPAEWSSSLLSGQAGAPFNLQGVCPAARSDARSSARDIFKTVYKAFEMVYHEKIIYPKLYIGKK